MLKFADGTRSAKVSAVAVNAWSPSSTPPSPPSSSPARRPLWHGSPWQRGAQGLRGGTWHAPARAAIVTSPRADTAAGYSWRELDRRPMSVVEVPDINRSLPKGLLLTPNRTLIEYRNLYAARGCRQGLRSR